MPSPVSVQFNQTDDKRCFHITIIDDFKREITETFEVALLPNTGVTIIDPSVATVSIIDDDTNRKYLNFCSIKMIFNIISHSFLLCVIALLYSIIRYIRFC